MRHWKYNDEPIRCGPFLHGDESSGEVDPGHVITKLNV